MPGETLKAKGLVALALMALPPLAMGACGEKKGSLMLAISTDMKAPKDVSLVSVTVLSNNSVKYNYLGRVAPNGEVKLPATLAIAESDDPNASIRIRVLAFQDRKPRVLRDVRTSIPRGGRQALLRLPLNFLDDRSATGELTAEQLAAVPRTSAAASGSSAGAGSGALGGSSLGGGFAARVSKLSSGGEPSAGFGTGELDPYSQFQSTCGPDDLLTSIDGECKDSYVDAASLPDYADELVFGSGGEGSCFDVARCLGGASPVTGDAPVDGANAGDTGGLSLRPLGGGLDLATCSVARGARDPSRLNLALVTPDTGECVAPGRCLVPLDKGERGWREEGAVLRLASSICKRIQEGRAQLAEVSGVCVPKTESTPPCTGDRVEPVDAGVQATLTLASKEDFPTSVTKRSDLGGILFVGATRIATLSKIGDQLSVRDVFAFTTPERRPWRLKTTEYGSVVTSSLSDDIYLVDRQSTSTRTIRGGVLAGGAPVEGVALSGGVYLTDDGGVLLRFPRSSADPQRVEPDGIQFGAYDAPITSLLGGSGDVNGTAYDLLVIGHASGISLLAVESSSADAGSSIGSSPPYPVGGRVDAMIGDPNDPAAFYVLVGAPGRLLRARAETPSLAPPSLAVVASELVPVPDDVAGVDVGSSYYPRGMITAGRCLVVTGKRSIHYCPDFRCYPSSDPRGKIPLPSTFEALGVAYANDELWVANYASQLDDGGIYRVALPRECSSNADTPSGGP